MASAEAEMGEIDEVRSKDEGEAIMNGDLSASEMSTEDSQDSLKKPSNRSNSIGDDHNESMEVDEEDEGLDRVSNSAPSEGPEENEQDEGEEVNDDDDDKEEEEESSQDEQPPEEDEHNDIGKEDGDDEEEVHEILDDDDDEEDEDEEREIKNGVADKEEEEPIELNDSGDNDGDVMIIEEANPPKENGSLGGNNNKRRTSNELEVIELNSSPNKKKIDWKSMVPRRSVRNINRQRSYVDEEREISTPQSSSEESDIEEVLPQDPLAAVGDRLEISKRPHHNKSLSISSNSGSTIVVKDTKRLVEIAAKSNSCNSGNKKEPTLVIIDTNSILSGRGPVPVHKSSSSIAHQSYPAILPMALPAQGMYPPNMRATITPIPLTHNSKSSASSSSSSQPAPVLPTLTDDMFVVEAPSFIVPYVYEKPPVSDFKDFVKDYEKEIKRQRREERKKDSANGDDDDDDDKVDADDKAVRDRDDDDYKPDPSEDVEGRKPYSYFESPLGKFFIDIGFNLVQEYVQTDLLKQQKRKRDREGGNNPTTNKTIHSLIKNLEFSKENNIPFKIPMKKCEFCNFKTESMLAMAHHLEQPHTKNYVYKCNFCTYEIRSPHDILFHMEAEHTIRGRLERAPAFHQCPNCPFEDNQKGKLSRHLVTCMRKFKPEKNLDPPIDWEPPAKIPRVPKQRQGLNASAYQAMKSSQLQMLSKMQMLNAQSTHPLHRGRGRPTSGVSAKANQMRPSGMVYKQNMSGGSVLVPTNYQLSGNQVYQVVGGGERLGHPGHVAFVSNVPSASTTVTIQNQKSKSMHQPSISITPLPRASSSPGQNMTSKPGDTNSKNSFVICEICDGYIKDLEQLRNHMQWIHKVKIHPKMIYNRPPLNCQKCQFRFFTDQGLERHLLGSHGLVTSSMQDAANKSKDAGRCPVCGRVYQWKLLNHVARDHNMTLKPAHLSYKCTVCTATFGMYKQFENHVYSAHSVVAKRVMDKKSTSASSKTDQLMKPLKINDEITIIPQPAKSASSLAGHSKEGSPSSTGSTNSRNSTPSTSKNADAVVALQNSLTGDRVAAAASCSSRSTTSSSGGANHSNDNNN